MIPPPMPVRLVAGLVGVRSAARLAGRATRRELSVASVVPWEIRYRYPLLESAETLHAQQREQAVEMLACFLLAGRTKSGSYFAHALAHDPEDLRISDALLLFQQIHAYRIADLSLRIAPGLADDPQDLLLRYDTELNHFVMHGVYQDQKEFEQLGRSRHQAKSPR